MKKSGNHAARGRPPGPSRRTPRGRYLGTRIRALRERRGLRPIDCAYLAGLSPQYWADLEAGRRRDPRWSTVQAIQRALSCRLEDLLPENDEI